MKDETERIAIEKDELKRKNSMLFRTLACSFRRSCSMIKSREELAAEKENKEERTSETNSQEGSVTAGSENQGDQASQCSSYTKEEKAVPEEKTVVKEDSVVPAASPVVLEEFQYKPAPVPEKNRFQAGVTFVDSQGYIYAQEVKEGELVSSFAV